MKKKALVEHNEARIHKRQKAAEKKRAMAEKVGHVELICNKDEVSKLKGEALNLQIQAFKQAGAPNLQGSVSTLKADQKRQALVEAVESMNAGKWKDSRQSKRGDDMDEGDADEDDENEEESDEAEDEDETNEGDTDEESIWEDEDE